MSIEEQTDYSDNPIYWESALIKEEDKSIFIEINGQQRRTCRTSNPRYENLLSSLKSTYPNLAPGKKCKFNHYRDGRSEILTFNL
tara:strand:+ start:308 stop:562 length:255 start_codon:yes stop_codon:yes gene_type:complete